MTPAQEDAILEAVETLHNVLAVVVTGQEPRVITGALLGLLSEVLVDSLRDASGLGKIVTTLDFMLRQRWAIVHNDAPAGDRVH